MQQPIDVSNFLEKYQEKWEKRATVRSRPYLSFDSDASGHHYPLARQPLCAHPRIMGLDEAALKFISTQSLYQYSYDISTIETKIVNNILLFLINDELPVKFDDLFKKNAFTVMVDESYHAYVAFDAMKRIEAFSGITPLPFPKTIEIEKAIQSIKLRLNEKYHRVFELIAVCIGENTLTQDIVSMVDEDSTHSFFQNMLSDHLSDESRHCGYFLAVLTYLWKQLEKDYKQHIGIVLPDFIELYLGVSNQIEFGKTILNYLKLGDAEISQIIDETYGGFKVTQQHPLLKNILRQLNKAGVIDEYTTPAFSKKQWL